MGATGYHEERGTQGQRYHRSPVRIREYERLEESRTKVSDFSEAKISSLGRDRIFSNHQLFLISLS